MSPTEPAEPAGEVALIRETGGERDRRDGPIRFAQLARGPLSRPISTELVRVRIARGRIASSRPATRRKRWSFCAWPSSGRLARLGREIEVPFRAAYPPTTDAKGNDRAGFVGEVVLDRKEYGVVGGSRFNRAFDPRISVIDDEVRIVFGVHVMIPPIRSQAVDSLVSLVEEEGVVTAVTAWNAEFPTGEGEEVERHRLRMAGLYNAAGAMSGLAEGYARAGMHDRAAAAVAQTLEIDPHETRALALQAWLSRR